jgi:hypothetical protein
MAEEPDRIREQIVETRERLGDTAAALAQKADVRSRARERALETRRALQDRLRSLRNPDELRRRGAAAARSGRERLPDAARERLPRATVGAIAAGLIAGVLIPLRRARRR